MKRKRKRNKGYVYTYRSWKLRFFTKTTLVLANTPITKWLHLRKKSVIHVNRWNTKKGIHLKTPQYSNYWHFPCVMLCTLPFVVQLQYILQYVKHLKCESGNNSTNQWQVFQRQQQENCCSLPCFIS